MHEPTDAMNRPVQRWAAAHLRLPRLRRVAAAPATARNRDTTRQGVGRRTLRQRVRYVFDQTLARGAVAVIGWLALISMLLVLGAAVVVALFQVQPETGAVGFIEATWLALLRTLDPGTMGEDTGWGFRVVMLGVTLAGVFVVSTLIGAVTTGMNAQLAELRKGRSLVMESDHTLIVGWSTKVFTILSELATANSNVSRPRVVILADRDKVTMEDEIRARLGGQLGRTKVICRSGDPLIPDDLAIANAAEAKSVVILAPDDDTSDAFALKALMALTRGSHRPAGCNHIVGTMSDERTAAAARIVAPDDATFINVDDLVARVMAQTCRQSGLSVVYTELLNFAGDEIYFHHEPALEGTRYGDALLRFAESSLIGIRRASGAVHVNPPMDTVFDADDQVIAIAADDDRVALAAEQDVPAVGDMAIVQRTAAPQAPEATLVLGWNSHGARTVQHLDPLVAGGSRVDVLTRERHDEDPRDLALQHLALRWIQGDPIDRVTLESLELAGYDHVILLSDSDGSYGDDPDTGTLLTLLHLRDLAARHGYRYSIVTEIEDVRNRQLAQSDHADDFIVSDEMISLMLAQVSENRSLHEVLSGLFDPAGSEVYLRPAGDYVVLGTELSYATVVEAARRRGETAIGFRSAADACDATRAFGLSVNPPKRTTRRFTADDRIVVLAAE